MSRATDASSPPFYWAPQRYGYNIVRLYPDAGATSVTVTFRGVTAASPSPDWRWGLVATDAGITTARYSALQKGSDGQLSFCVNAGESLWLVVSATPSTQQKLSWDQSYSTVPRYPYMIELDDAWPDGFQGGNAGCLSIGPFPRQQRRRLRSVGHGGLRRPLRNGSKRRHRGK